MTQRSALRQLEQQIDAIEAQPDLLDEREHVDAVYAAIQALDEGSLRVAEKRDGRWALRYRQVVMDWSDTFSVTDSRDSEAFSALAKGCNNSRDPLYAHLAGD